MSDTLTAPILFLHNVFIICLFIVIVFNIYLLILFICWCFGFTNMNPFTNIPFLSPLLYNGSYLIYRIAAIILQILLVVLFWVFVFWMLIIIFVPFIIIFPIPIFPFIFILPLKPLMLLLIPPFKTLTDLGTLQLTYKVITRMFSEQMFTNFANYFLYPTGKDLYSYLYYNMTEIFGEFDEENYAKLFNNEDYFKNKNDEKYQNQTGKTKEMGNLETNDDPKDIDIYNDHIEKKSVSTGMKKIEEDTNRCISMQQKFKLYNSSYIDDVQTDMSNSFSPYNDCYIKAIKSYIKTSIK